MSKNSSNINESAKRYAKALMLYSENSDIMIKKFQNDFEKLLSVFKEVVEFKNFVLTPLVKKSKKKRNFNKSIKNDECISRIYRLF